MLLLKVLLILGLVALNAFFVAAEYALLSVRRTRVEQLIREGNPRARLVLNLFKDVSALFTGIQLGITIASVLMGWIGEEIIAQAIHGWLSGYLEDFTSAVVAHSISVALAFLFATSLLMVLGELVPKGLGYERAEKIALMTARPMVLFMRSFKLPVMVLDGVSNLVLRAMKIVPGQSHRAVHTPEEIKLLVSSIPKYGLLGKDQAEMIRGAIDLHQMRVREIMVPWNRITCLPLTSDLRTLLDRIVQDQHSRVPIYEGLPDQIVGVLYTKDLLAVLSERLRRGIPAETPFNLRLILHQPMIVPEIMSLNQMLSEARRRQSQMALVVDEFGTFTGLVTIEDVLEQIVGEIRDEYDLEEAAIRRLGDNVMVVDASVSLRELADDFDVALPRGLGYETLAGFILARLGTIPKGGESFVLENRRYTVAEMDGRRVSKVRIESLPAAASGAPSSVGRHAPQSS